MERRSKSWCPPMHGMASCGWFGIWPTCEWLVGCLKAWHASGVRWCPTRKKEWWRVEVGSNCPANQPPNHGHLAIGHKPTNTIPTPWSAPIGHRKTWVRYGIWQCGTPKARKALGETFHNSSWSWLILGASSGLGPDRPGLPQARRAHLKA